MSPLSKLKALLGNPSDPDEVLQFYLDNAADIICDRRHSNEVENVYLTHQIKIAIELYNKRGAEGETAHGENGVSRSYESADVSPSLLNTITQIVRTPYSKVRIVNIE